MCVRASSRKEDCYGEGVVLLVLEGGPQNAICNLRGRVEMGYGI